MLFGQRPKILIIDDVPDNVELLGAALDDFCDVRFALSGADGLAMLDSYLPNLILLDVMMPGMDGYEVCDLLKHDSRTRGIPVIFVTARTDPASETRALMGGGADFIHKPFNRDTVRVRVRTQLELKARELECRQARDDLSHQVVERTRALEDALAQAEAASRAKSNFLATVSHELKTPLNAILGYAFVLNRRLDDPVLRERSERIRESGLRLLGVVNNILDASNLTGDGAALEGIDFHLLEMLNLCEEQLVERARNKGLGLAREIDPALPLVLHGDPLRIGQVLGNLLDNAVKFSEQGCIALRVGRRVVDGLGLVVRFEVEDQGIGIPAESRALLFEDFRQLDDSSTRRFGGCGLGLSICRQLVNRMEGRIGLEAAPGGGSVFWFQIPLAPAQGESGPQLTLAYLRRLLETESLMARTLWGQCRPVLLPLLGQDGALLEQALEQAELSRALELLMRPRERSMSDDRLETLVRAFESELPRYLSELQEAWQGPRRGTRDAMLKIQEIAHKLSGSAGAYGYSGLAEAAVAVAATAAEVLSHFGQGHNPIQQRLFGQLNALGAHLAMPVRVEAGLDSLAGPARDRGRVRHVVLVDDDVAYARLLQAEMQHFGFEVDILTDLTALTHYLDQQQPDLIVMDVSFPEGQVAGPKAVQGIRAHAHGGVPVIFISARDTIGSRLAAVRAGGEAFFVKPFDVAELMDAVDRILGGEQQAAYRVLVVDDAASLARLYASTLEQAGMIAQAVSNPFEVLEAMESFHPDLLLMDIYMPDISGVELARIIQQHRSYLGVPIVFLSAERDPVKQMEALGQGGDNFLTKPIEGAELVKAVSIRAHHYQTLRSLMLKDSLTGLLNHSRLLEQLDHELRRAARQNQPLSVAMINIDHFKSVNDTWGHAVGDSVILTLARLLRERLRVSDVVGRYGGEEFLVVMPEAGLEDARRVIESLRESFARISHRVGDTDFTVSFSAGVAQMTPQCVDRALMEKADQALYQAKHSGRNRVCVAPLC